jgi:hypothetical protein
MRKGGLGRRGKEEGKEETFRARFTSSPQHDDNRRKKGKRRVSANIDM